MDDRGRAAPAAALQAATIVPARWLGAEADLGTLEVGKRADLLRWPPTRPPTPRRGGRSGW